MLTLCAARSRRPYGAGTLSVKARVQFCAISAPIPALAPADLTVALQVRHGALGGTRTPSLLIRSQMLYPLSYERWS
jgi:hypothetical protein